MEENFQQDQGEGEGPRIEELLDHFESGEKKRRAISMVAGVIIFVIGLSAVFSTVLFRTELFAPRYDIDAKEQETFEMTNDPACRQMIADVTTLGSEWLRSENDIEDALLSRDVNQLHEAEAVLGKFSARLEGIQTRSQKANLRFDHSRPELDRWFDFVQRELSVLRTVAAETRDELEPREQKYDDAAVEGEEGDAPEREAEPVRSSRERGELRDKALIAIRDSFDSFRVWHTASQHPCGPADQQIKSEDSAEIEE